MWMRGKETAGARCRLPPPPVGTAGGQATQQPCHLPLCLLRCAADAKTCEKYFTDVKVRQPRQSLHGCQLLRTRCPA